MKFKLTTTCGNEAFVHVFDSDNYATSIKTAEIILGEIKEDLDYDNIVNLPIERIDGIE